VSPGEGFSLGKQCKPRRVGSNAKVVSPRGARYLQTGPDWGGRPFWDCRETGWLAMVHRHRIVS
jgi:hypothetical protein